MTDIKALDMRLVRVDASKRGAGLQLLDATNGRPEAFGYVGLTPEQARDLAKVLVAVVDRWPV